MKYHFGVSVNHILGELLGRKEEILSSKQRSNVSVHNTISSSVQ